MTSTSIRVDRPAAEVFAYVTDPTRFHEWQQGVVSGDLNEPGPPEVGSHCSMTRRIGGSNRGSTSVVTKLDPPTSWGVRGIGKMLVPLVVRRQAAREMPTNLQRLKERLESMAQ